jgi:serine/threonine protein kinase/Rieske Fe-S protein
MQGIENHQLTGKDAGNYHIDRLLGKGSLSHFYEAHTTSGQRVMLTAFSLPETSSPQVHARFLTHFMQEGPALTWLKHPAIIPVYDYGEYDGYPYLITPFVPGSSLAQILQSQGRFSVESALQVLRQVADGLDYAHRNGILHGSLSAANIVQGSESTVQIAGFGFMHILARQHLEQDSRSDTRLLHNAKMFAGTPARMAPEIMAAAIGQNVPFDARVDIYALGILLFELISGRLPFTGVTPLEVAQQQTQQPIPSLAALYPTLPASIDVVLQKALARHPEQRFQSAGELTHAFEQALNSYSANTNGLASLSRNAPDTQTTSPLTIIHDAGKDRATGNHSTSSIYPKLTLPLSSSKTPQSGDTPDFDPFVWWTNVSPMQTVTHPKTARAAFSAAQKVEKHRKDRRKVVALLTAGSVVAIVGFGGGTIALAHILSNHSGQSQTASTQPQLPAPTAQPQKPTPTVEPTPTHSTKSQQPAPTAQPQKPTATTKAAPTPTPQPPTPTPRPQHTGTVIGSTNMPSNTAKNFTNPANGNGSILIHLPNGNFVAYSRACTHAGVPVNYDSGSHQLVCPAHGAVFNPANNANPVQGPTNGPLSTVAIHVNGDGTITVG